MKISDSIKRHSTLPNKRQANRNTKETGNAGKMTYGGSIMEKNAKRGDQCLSGVSCDVATCVYHSPGNCCTAKGIAVENENAEMKVETFCATFAPKDSCC